MTKLERKLKAQARAQERKLTYHCAVKIGGGKGVQRSTHYKNQFKHRKDGI